MRRYCTCKLRLSKVSFVCILNEIEKGQMIRVHPLNLLENEILFSSIVLFTKPFADGAVGSRRCSVKLRVEYLASYSVEKL